MGGGDSCAATSCVASAALLYDVLGDVSEYAGGVLDGGEDDASFAGPGWS